MNIIICGCEHTESGLEKIKELQRFLQNNGYKAHFVSDRDLSDLSLSQIPEKELEQVKKADVVILVPSFSTSNDPGSLLNAYYRFALDTKPVLIYAQDEVYPELDSLFNLIARKVCRSEQELLNSIEELGEPEENEVNPNMIGVIPNVYGDHEAEFEYKEFRCICPVTGERDRATIKIAYAPHKWLMEYESLDSYFKQFVDRKIHHEGVVNEVFHHLNHILQPKWIKVVAEFEPRSGVKAKIEKRSK